MAIDFWKVEDMDTKKYHIAQFGTYDIESLGDTTFPKVFSYGLQQYVDCDITLFSMTECLQPYNNNSHVFSFDQFMKQHRLRPFDAVVIGGGEFLHFKGMDVLIKGKKETYPEGYIWQKPLEMASKENVPAFLNLVGAPYDLAVKQQETLRKYLKSVKYASVRDVFSEKRFLAAGAENVQCVADNLWYLNRMYPRAEMAVLRGELAQRTGRDFTSPYIIVQYGTTRDVKTLAKQLKAIKDAYGLRICLMSVNYCHEDRVGMEMLCKEGDGAFEVVTDYFQPPEMIAVISGAKAFIGTSLHGNLTAASYGVPFIAIDMYPSFVSKMDGIFSMIDCEAYLAPDEGAVKAAFDARLADQTRGADIAERIVDIQQKLDLHFQHIAQILKGEC